MCFCGESYQQSGKEWGKVEFIRILAARFKVEYSD